jgi:serine/threonine protein kinase
MLTIGVNTALPLALIERRSPREAWLLTTYIPDLVDLDNAILQLLPRLERQRRYSVKNTIASEVAGLLVCLHSNGLTHRDLKASNIMLTSWDGRAGPAKVWLVDLDGLGRLPRIGNARRWRSLTRLAASLRGHSSITHSDYARFLKSLMRQLGIPQTEWKRHYRDLAKEADTYVRRAGRRKMGKLDGFTGED